MAFQLFNRQQKTANLVFTDQAIRFIELGNGAKREIVKMAERHIGLGKIKNGKIIDSQSLSLILEECVEEWGIKKRPVRIIIPDLHIVVRQIEVPIDVREDELKGYLFLEFGSSIHLPFEEPVFDCVPLGEDGHKQKVLLIAAPEEVVMDYTNLIEKVKLQPIAADIGPLSLYRLCHFSGLANKEDHLMILNIDESLLTISIFHDDILIFMRPVSLEAELEIAVIDPLTGLENSDDFYQLEDAFHEIEKVMNFYTYTLNQGNAEVNRILLTATIRI